MKKPKAQPKAAVIWKGTVWEGDAELKRLMRPRYTKVGNLLVMASRRGR